MRVLAEGASRSHLWLLRLPDLEVLTLVLERLPRPNRELISNGCWRFFHSAWGLTSMLAKVRALYCTISCGRSWSESTNLNAVSPPIVAVTKLCVLP